MKFKGILKDLGRIIESDNIKEIFDLIKQTNCKSYVIIKKGI